MSVSDEGVRLSKKIAAQLACSRREAEALIFSGAVQVNGHVASDPARRVKNETLTVNRLGMSAAHQGLTLLAHQIGGAPLDMAALRTILKSDPQAPWRSERLARLQAASALHPAASGLCVFTDDPAILRHLQDTRNPMEHEWMATVTGAISAPLLKGLQHPGLRISLNRDTETHCVLRVAGKQAQGPGFAEWLAGVLPLQDLHLQRIGRIGLAAMPAGAWRVLAPEERF